MRALIRVALCFAALAGGVGGAAAQATAVSVQLSPEQRTQVYQTIIREKHQAAPEGVPVRIGARVPQAVELYEVPASVAVEMPVLKRYKYMVVSNQVVLVDPATSEIVEILQR